MSTSNLNDSYSNNMHKRYFKIIKLNINGNKVTKILTIDGKCFSPKGRK